MADINLSAASTSNLIVAFSNFMKNSEAYCDRLINLSNKLIGEDGGRLKGGDGEAAAEIVAKLKVAAENLKNDASAINNELDTKLSAILSMNKGATADIADKANRDINKIGNVVKKH